MPAEPRATADDPGPLIEAYVEAAFAMHAARLRAFAMSLVHDPDTADDLVQESFVRLVREAQVGRAPFNTAAWLHRVCANLAISGTRRTSSLRRAMPRLVDGGSVTSPEDVAERRDHDARILEALTGLPADARAALLLAADGLGSREIGLLIGRTPVATRAFLCRMRGRLARAVEA